MARSRRVGFSLRAGPVAIRQELSGAAWALIGLALALCLTLALGAGYALGRHAQPTGGVQPLAAAESETPLRPAALERQLEIEHATQANLSAQLKAQADENALLKEDLAFFQTLGLGRRDAAGAVRINRLRVEPQALPGELRYRFLLVHTRSRGPGFEGRLELVVDLEQEGRTQVLVLPARRESPGYTLSFRLYQRIEGTFNVPRAAVVKRVQVRVFENGGDTPVSSQIVNLS